MLTTLAAAKLHLRVDGSEEDALITARIVAAEAMAVHYLGRNVYADQAALDAAVAAAPGLLSTATAAHDAAVAAAGGLSSAVERAAALAAADDSYLNAQADARRARAGIVVNDSFTSAVLLIVGTQFDERENPTLPKASEWLLQPYRVYG